MDAGRLTVTGQTEAAANVKLEWKQEEETLDAFGNIVKIKQQKKSMNNKEKKKVGCFFFCLSACTCSTIAQLSEMKR